MITPDSTYEWRSYSGATLSGALLTGAAKRYTCSSQDRHTDLAVPGAHPLLA